jgi:hypothetical protein
MVVFVNKVPLIWGREDTMTRAYISETRHSHLEDLRCVASTLQYEVSAPGTTFGFQVQSQLAQARTYHLEDELGLALEGYHPLQALILKTVHPQPVHEGLPPPGLDDAGLRRADRCTAVDHRGGDGAHAGGPPNLPTSAVNPDPLPDTVRKMMLKPFAALARADWGTTLDLALSRCRRCNL